MAVIVCASFSSPTPPRTCCICTHHVWMSVDRSRTRPSPPFRPRHLFPTAHPPTNQPQPTYRVPVLEQGHARGLAHRRRRLGHHHHAATVRGVGLGAQELNHVREAGNDAQHQAREPHPAQRLDLLLLRGTGHGLLLRCGVRMGWGGVGGCVALGWMVALLCSGLRQSRRRKPPPPPKSNRHAPTTTISFCARRREEEATEHAHVGGGIEVAAGTPRAPDEGLWRAAWATAGERRTSFVFNSSRHPSDGLRQDTWWLLSSSMGTRHHPTPP